MVVAQSMEQTMHRVNTARTRREDVVVFLSFVREICSRRRPIKKIRISMRLRVFCFHWCRFAHNLL